MDSAANNDDKQTLAGNSDPADNPSEGNMIKLQIKTARVQKFITVAESTSIRDLRARTAELFEIEDPTLTVLIFGGKILKDTEDVKTHGK